MPVSVLTIRVEILWLTVYLTKSGCSYVEITARAFCLNTLVSLLQSYYRSIDV
jgi:hypothetical protein